MSQGHKLVPLSLVGLDGNAFSIMGAFSRAARKAKWPKDEIDAVLVDAMSGNYDHLLSVISSHCVNGGFGE